MWHYGEPERPHFAEPTTVVRDDQDGLVAWLAAGTPVMRKIRSDGGELRSDPDSMFSAPAIQGTGVWTGYDVLRVAPTG